MTWYVALLRGIGPFNPNMRNARLRSVVEGAGFRDVQTVISSGNVVFTSDRADTQVMEAELEEAWPAQLGFQSTTIIRSQGRLSRLIAADPYDGMEHGPESYLLVTFCKEPPALQWDLPHTPAGKAYTLVAMVDGTLFSVTDTTAESADVMVWLDRQFGKQISSRTWDTLGRIVKRMG